MSGTDEQLSEREEIELLLPWYMSGRLDAADRARVESYLTAHPDMRHQLALIAEEQAATIEGNEAIVRRLAPPKVLQATGETQGNAVHAWLKALMDGARAFFEAPAPGAVRWAAAAAAVVICLQAAALATLLLQDSGSGYQTASRPAAIEPGEGAVAVIAFADGASMADISRLLADNRLRVADGPLPGGFYSVRFEDAATANEQQRRFDAILARKDLIRAVMTGR